MCLSGLFFCESMSVRSFFVIFDKLQNQRQTSLIDLVFGCVDDTDLRSISDILESMIESPSFVIWLLETLISVLFKKSLFYLVARRCSTRSTSLIPRLERFSW